MNKSALRQEKAKLLKQVARQVKTYALSGYPENWDWSTQERIERRLTEINSLLKGA